MWPTYQYTGPPPLQPTTTTNMPFTTVHTTNSVPPLSLPQTKPSATFVSQDRVIRFTEEFWNLVKNDTIIPMWKVHATFKRIYHAFNGTVGGCRIILYVGENVNQWKNDSPYSFDPSHVSIMVMSTEKQLNYDILRRIEQENKDYE